MKVLLLGLLATIASAKWLKDDTCPEAKQVTCVDDFRAAY
jgi:hypothetical protein